MRMFKFALLSASLIIVLVILLSLLLPSRVVVSRAIDLSVAKSKIWEGLHDLPQWPVWNSMTTAAGKQTWSVATDSLVGTQMTIVLLPNQGDTLPMQWISENGKAMKAGFVVHQSADGSSSVLQWYFDFQLGWYPWEKFTSIILDKQLGPLMEQSLEGFKQELARRP